MKKYVLAGMIALGILSMGAQESTAPAITLQKGDVIEIGNPSTYKYKYIKFPRANFIVQRDGVKNYKSALGEEVVVTDIKTAKDGSRLVYVKRQDGKRFFNTVNTVSIQFEKALATHEIKI